MSYEISEDCIGCGLCAKKCPAKAIDGIKKQRFDIHPALCDECGICFENCPKAAIIDPNGKRRKIEKGKKRKPQKAFIDSGLCAGCQTCLMNCPQEAIQFIKKGIHGKGFSQVELELCLGCGTCSRFCITGAISFGPKS